MQWEKLSIENIGNGAIPELFTDALQRILADIADINKPAESDRSVEFKIKFRTDDERSVAAIEIETTIKVPKRKSVGGYVILCSGSDNIT